MKYKHFPRNWPFMRGIHQGNAGNSQVPVEIPAQRPVTQSFGVFFDLRLIRRLINNRKAGDLIRYRAHYDVIVMDLSEINVNVLYLQYGPITIRILFVIFSVLYLAFANIYYT